MQMLLMMMEGGDLEKRRGNEWGGDGEIKGRGEESGTDGGCADNVQVT